MCPYIFLIKWIGSSYSCNPCENLFDVPIILKKHKKLNYPFMWLMHEFCYFWIFLKDLSFSLFPLFFFLVPFIYFFYFLFPWFSPFISLLYMSPSFLLFPTFKLFFSLFLLFFPLLFFFQDANFFIWNVKYLFLKGEEEGKFDKMVNNSEK